MIQRRVRAALPAGVILPRDARDAALARLHFAPLLLGGVTLDRLIDVDPVWRPLLIALRFAGMASPAAVIDGLSSNFPLLDEFNHRLRQTDASADTERETDRQVSTRCCLTFQWSAWRTLGPRRVSRYR